MKFVTEFNNNVINKFKKYRKNCSFGHDKVFYNKNKTYISNVCAFLVCRRNCSLSFERLNTILRNIVKGLDNKCVKKFYKKKSKRLYVVNVQTKFFSVRTKKSSGMRMGKGKGSLIYKVIPLRLGQVILTINFGLGFIFLKKVLVILMKKLPIRFFKFFINE